MPAPPDPSARAPALLLATLCWAVFMIAGAATAIAPFLLDMARDLGTGLAAVANLIAFLSVAWGVMSLVAGSASDRLGRRPILLATLLCCAVSRVGLATAESYGVAVAWQIVGGLGGGGFMGTVFAAVSDHVGPAGRGRALGWVITGQSLSLVFGVPAFTLLGGLIGWRRAIGVQAAVMLATAVAVWLALPPSPARPAARERHSAASILPLLRPDVLALLAASAMERGCFAGLTVYLATYLVVSYGVAPGALAVALALVAAGNLVGNVLGGQLADRLPARALTFAVASLLTGLFALPLMLWQPGLAGSIALGFAYSLANSVGRPALMAVLSEISSGARGAVLGLNITTGSLGWLGAASLGGWLIGHYGFGGLGVLSAAAAVAGAALGLWSWWLSHSLSLPGRGSG
jgi:MFS transporter, DHA1 family, inner membrane transport protein